MHLKYLLLACFTFLIIACGGGGSPTSPTNPTIPSTTIPTAIAQSSVKVLNGRKTIILSGTVDASLNIASYNTTVPSNGFLNPPISGGQTLVYTAKLLSNGDTFAGDDYFTFTVTDSQGNVSAAATVSLQVAYFVLKQEKRSFAYPATPSHIYEASIEMLFCDASPCCAMYLSRDKEATNTTPQKDKSSSVATNVSTIKNILDFTQTGTLFVNVFGIGANGCAFNKPKITATQPTIQTKKTLNLSGQQHQGGMNQFSNFIATEVEGITYLRDYSKRVGNTDVMEIKTLQFVEVPWDRNLYQHKDELASNISNLNRAAIDAHGNTQIVYDYLKNKLGLYSYDNKNSSMVSAVNYHYPIAATVFCNSLTQPNTLFNAFFTGVDGIKFTPPVASYASGAGASSSLDIVGHEWAHGIQSPSGNRLNYQRESGALEEAYSDWLGVAVSRSKNKTNWIIGDEVFNRNGTLGARSLQNPNIFNHPDTYKGQYWKAADSSNCPIPDVCTNDYCGVHLNSGVGNKMFYLLSEGGSHNGVTVAGVGIDTAINIATIAKRQYWTRNTTFSSARIGMVQAAANYGSTVTTQVNLAWEAVGVK